jgi:hypothetical protein
MTTTSTPLQMPAPFAPYDDLVWIPGRIVESGSEKCLPEGWPVHGVRSLVLPERRRGTASS